MTGAEARGGLAQLFATQGGQATLGQNLLISAIAIAAQSDLANPSTVSDSFGGNAAIRVFGGGGTINVGGTALLDASAFAGAVNAVGGGALADAGEANVSVEGAGAMVFSNTLDLSANAFGGANGNGQGGQALGGAARLLVNGTGGSVTVNGNFAATARAQAGIGTSGGDGFGGIAGANAVVGNIAINGTALASAEGFGGSVGFGFGGDGGLGRGGNAFFQADGTLAEAARVVITGDATAVANGAGGTGGGASAAFGTPAGRGGDGIGGQFTVPNQADPTRNSGAFILAGGDNGTIEVGGNALAAATGFGGFGGNGTTVIAGGLGGNGVGGLAQVGLALLGQSGSLGQGIARFADLRAEADGFGGAGGFSPAEIPIGPGGTGTGGNALMTVRAGDITANRIELRASGTGGDGVGAGSGNGGTATVLGSLGGTLTATGLDILAGGVGGAANLDGAGGNSFGGRAGIEGDGITVTVNGNALVDATATGGAARNGAGGNGTGGQALIATVTPGNGGAVTITGHAQIFANGDGGAATVGAFAGGTGTGGLAYLDALGGGAITLGSAQVHAVGRGGVSEFHEGGDGIGGTVRLNASGAGSRLTIQSNVPNAFGEVLGGLTVANANGLGAVTVGGDGIGGLGRGGTLDLVAGPGGSLALPIGTPAFYLARGFGGNSSAEGGTGGGASGGTAAITVDGGTMVAGSATLSAFAQGGASADPARNITGGNATGGTRRVRVVNTGTLAMEGNGGGAGAQGGDGSGSGNGGDALAGSVLMEVIDSTVNLAGNFILFNQSAGGGGQRGGNAGGGTIDLNAANARINLAPGASGPGALTLSNAMQGGQGVVAGGNAVGGNVTAIVTGSQIGGGRLDFTQTATGGNATAATGTGGNADGAVLAATFTNSTLNLAGEVIFSADARGGAGGAAGSGGSATAGTAEVNLVTTIADIVADQQGIPGIVRVRSEANGGAGGLTGNATARRALLGLDGAALSASAVHIEARAFAANAVPGQTGGAASGGEALFNLGGAAQVSATLLELSANARTAQGGSATGGRAAIEALIGSNAALTVPRIEVFADAITGADTAGGIAGTTQGGQVFVSANGGALAITGNIEARARGVGAAVADLVTGAAARGGLARLRALQGGNVTLTGNITLDASATGSTGSLTGPSVRSDAFGGDAGIFVLSGGGSLRVTGQAQALANARGGSSSNAGAGSLADAGMALANIDAAGLIEIGTLTLDARAQGGENAGGTGGMALGGRASAATFGGGTIRLGRLDANTLAVGGNGLTGGNAFGGIAGANAIIGEIAITGRAFAGSEGIGGSATFGVGGSGGNGRGGNAFFQADGSLTQTARLSITGDAIAFARGVGGNGGDGDAVTAGGRGGDGFGGGQGNIPNQADPAFGSGAFILAGGDNGTIIIGGEAVAVGTAAGGRGGNGGQGTAGGRGGDAFGGLAQTGLALLGGTGAVGLGSAQLGRMVVQSDAVAGDGGIASVAAQNGDGGNGTGGTSVLTVRAGNVVANAAEIAASGFGGRGATGGNGTGGVAGVFGSLSGTLTLGQLQVIANGLGEDSNGTGNGGSGRGGGAFVDFAAMQTTITGDVLVEASGFGDTATVGIGGNGIGGTARIGTLGTGAGDGTIAGTIRVLANGVGGVAPTGGEAAGGQALLALAGSGAVNAPLIEIAANGQTSAGGTARGGTASLTLATGSTAVVNVAQLRLLANATGAAPGTGANGAGRFLVDIGGGSVNAGSLTASARGDSLIGAPPASELAAQGGNLNVTGTLAAATFGDLLVRSGQGAVIGSTAATPTATAIQLDAGGTIEIRGDGSATGGLGGQSASLLAGRSILLNGNLSARDGPVTLTANRSGGQVLAQPPASVITMAQGSRIAAGTGTVTMRLLDGAGDPQRASGAIQLAGISAARIDVRNQGTSPGSDIRVLSGGGLTASGTGRAIDLAALGGEVVNLAGDAGLVLTGGGHYGIFAATPTGSQIGSFANYARRYNVATAAAYDTLNPGGNFAAFRFAPVLTVTANNAARVFGNANPVFTASFAGFMPGDGIANLAGAPLFGTSATVTSNIGTFAITAALGSLLSEQGYQFTFAPGVLTITPRPITVTANNLSRVYGNANPALTFTVGGDGLVNGDQLVGALVTTAGARTGVGIIPITQGTLAASANYVLTFVAGQLTITPRPLTITAANQSKLFGRPDPALTFSLGGGGLVNDDQLTGALVRDPGELIGRYAIRQGTLTGGANYAITFVPGELTITPPPTPPELANPTVMDSLAAGSDPVTASAAEEEKRFGMDFPEQPDAPLISEDPLLDDPVSSGGDASLYAGTGGARPDSGEK